MLKVIIKTMCINPVWLIFHPHDLILKKERKRCQKKKKRKKERYNNLEAVYADGYSEPSRASTMKLLLRN